MNVSLNTTVREIIENHRDSLEIFEKHGVCVEDECPDGILDFELADCEGMCHIDDINQLVEDLNGFLAAKE